MNATGLNIDLREGAEIKRQRIDLRNRLTTGTLSMQTPDQAFQVIDEATSDRVRASVFQGEPLEFSMTGETLWVPVRDYFSLVSFIVIETENAKWIIQRLLSGEIVRVGEVFIRKTPEARRGLSQSRL
jgi:hypothetical protein